MATNGHQQAPSLESRTAGTWLWPPTATNGHQRELRLRDGQQEPGCGHQRPPMATNVHQWALSLLDSRNLAVATKPGEPDSENLAVATNGHQRPPTSMETGETARTWLWPPVASREWSSGSSAAADFEGPKIAQRLVQSNSDQGTWPEMDTGEVDTAEVDTDGHSRDGHSQRWTQQRWTHQTWTCQRWTQQRWTQPEVDTARSGHRGLPLTPATPGGTFTTSRGFLCPPQPRPTPAGPSSASLPQQIGPFVYLTLLTRPPRHPAGPQ
ncbi:uncharacterized protein LOC131587520 [Poecile atricapillus]|uniref:uncharacterized protein LOC131587520 n=1 Tax=Poecile atricapillus TaxID=48891 RepID=UPI0027386921|nr:uncharacterized protein LOC131587520 [Poecile atricapillus]